MLTHNFFVPYAALISLSVIAVIFLNYQSGYQHLKRSLAFILIILPIAYFFRFLFTNISDIPFSDDYNLLDSFIRMITATTWEGRIQALFEQVNQHRFAFERIAMYILYLISGTFSVKAHVLTGNLALIGIVALLYQYFKKSNLSLYYFIPVPLLIFSLLFYENAIWSIAALQNTPIIFFAMLTAYLLGHSKYFGALITAIITTFISGNGVAIWIVGIIILFFREKYYRLFSWLIIAGIVLSFYFLYDYTYYKSEGTSILSFPLKNFVLANAFWGNIFYGDFSHLDTRTLYPDILATVLTGLILFVLTLLLLFKTVVYNQYNRQPANWMIIGTMMFLLATGSMLTISRPTEWNILHGGDIFSRRYMIFGTAFFACGYLVIIEFVKNNKLLSNFIFAGTGLLACVMHLGSYYFFGPKVIATQEELTLDSYYLNNHKTLLSVGETYGEKPFWNHPTTFLNLLETADRHQLFKHPSSAVHDKIVHQEIITAPLFSSLKLRSYEERAGKNLGNIGKKITLLLENNPALDSEIKYFIFRSSDNRFIVPAVLRNIPVKKPGDLFQTKYGYTFRPEKFPVGVYDVQVVTKNKNSQYLVYNLDKSIVLKGHVE